MAKDKDNTTRRPFRLHFTDYYKRNDNSGRWIKRREWSIVQRHEDYEDADDAGRRIAKEESERGRKSVAFGGWDYADDSIVDVILGSFSDRNTRCC